MARQKREIPRTQKVAFTLTIEELENLKALSYLEDKPMSECVINLISREVEKRAEDIQAIRKIQKNSL